MSEISGQAFGSARTEYDQGRPGYPAEAVARLLTGDVRTVADIGAGTGKLTASLLGEGRRVIAVDPDARMLQTLSESLPAVETRVGTAEELPLETASCDLLTFGQSWHWVDEPVACAEAARVLRPGGVLGLVWNIRDESVDWVAALTEIIAPSAAERYVARLVGPGGAGPGAEADGAGEAAAAEAGSAGESRVAHSPFAPPFTALEHHRIAWVRRLSVDDLVALVASRSGTIHAEPAVRARMLEATRHLGEQVRGREGLIDLRYTTHVFRAGTPDRPRS